MSTTSQAQLVQGLEALAQGDLTTRLMADDEVATAFNALAEQLQRVTQELQRVGDRTAAGALGLQVEVGELRGEWKRTMLSVDAMSRTTTNALRNIGQIVVQLNRGMPAGHMQANCQQELGELKEVVDELVDRFGATAAAAR
jgi:HAMP domain-containing protein